MIAILAIGETFVIITAGIDLSVGAIVGFTSVIVAWLLTHGFPIFPAVLITLVVGFGIGIKRNKDSGKNRRQARSEEHTSELQSHSDLVCRLLLEKKKKETL